MNYKPNFTDDEIIRRVNDILEIKNVFGRHAYYHAFGLHEQELKEIWVNEPENRATASFGQNWGYNIGMDRIEQYYGKGLQENYQKDLDLLCAEDPSIENIPENLGMGMTLMHALTTPYIEVAGDGQTAQGLWYSPGQVTGPKMAVYMNEKYGVDFKKEYDETAGETRWKIWHLFVGTDYALEPGGQLTDQDTPFEKARKGDGPIGPQSEPEPGFYPMEAYSIKFNYSAYPPQPQPYYTFADAISNGIEGNPNYRKEG